ncbi:MAG: EAL domain-containing protein [Methylococcaceae bacterium]|nr:EAL domain-containing protein [Methylococcaceae bacterium]
MKANQNGKTRILVVEDSRTQAQQLSMLLEQHGYQVTVAINGKQAFEVMRLQKPTLVISDVVMPEMDGYELCKSIKSDEQLKDIPVILVTALSDSQDVIRGLVCGADNFIRKPYDEHYLLSRIDYLLMNLELRKNQKMQLGVEIDLGGQKHFINAERQQILDLLISTYEQAIHINGELKQREKELEHSNQVLNGLYRIAEGLNQAVSEQQMAELALEHALSLPGIQAGWISIHNEKSGFRLAASRNLPPALSAPEAMEGECECRRMLLRGELDNVTNMFKCERLAKAKGDTLGLICHACVPFAIDAGRTLGIMNLVGDGEGFFNEDELKVLHGVGQQVAVALERSRLHEHLEQLVEEKTAKLTAEVEKRKRIQEEQARLVAIIEATPDFVATGDLDGHALYFNQAGLRMLGYVPGQDVSGLRVGAGHPDWALKLVRETAIPHAIAHGSWSGETAFLRPDGTEMPLLQVLIAHKKSDGAVEYLSTIARDITERKQAEITLRVSEEKFRAIFEGTLDGILLADAESKRFATGNPAICRMLGYSPEELVRCGISDIHQQQDLPHAIDQFEGLLRGEIQLAENIPVKRKDGSVFYADIKSSVVKYGDKTYLLGVFRDITQLKTNEARIARLNRIYSVLSGINTAIVRVHDEEELFREACRIAVEHGKFVFAWIGQFDAPNQQVTPLAQAGRDEGYLDRINLTTRGGIKGSCALTTQALTEMKPVICNDIANDERMAAWSDAALSRGYRSVTVLPLLLEKKPVGVFALYAPEPDAFDDDEMDLLVEMAGDISFALDHLQKEEKLNYLAYYDIITGLPNRSLFQDRLAQRINVTRLAKQEFSVIILNLERFSRINETFGRQIGDDLLRQLAQRLKEALGETDILARLMADNFGIAIAHNEHELSIARVIEKILSSILIQPFNLGGQELRVSARAGVSSYPVDGEDIEKLIRNAEAALKRAKLSGHKYLFYTPEFNARVAEKLALENKLRNALEQSHLMLHYQPKVDIKSGQICGLEALMRWTDLETGPVPPGKFIPIFEETGLITDAGAWVLEQALSDYCKWRDRGLPSPRIAVNISQIQLQRDDFVSTIKRMVNSDPHMADGLEIEITESMLIQDIENSILKLQAIREMGVEVAIDDFGTGYSSLSYIAKLPINSLKIDRAFIVNMTSNPDDLSIVSTVISLAHALNLRVIAEGVETVEQANLLRLLKCDELQGFLFSPAVSAEQIEVFLREKKSMYV